MSLFCLLLLHETKIMLHHLAFTRPLDYIGGGGQKKHLGVRLQISWDDVTKNGNSNKSVCNQNVTMLHTGNGFVYFKVVRCQTNFFLYSKSCMLPHLL